jgi:putative transposase
LLRTGCPGRYLQERQLSAAAGGLRKFQRDGVWEAIWAELRMALRKQTGPEASHSAAVLDSRLIKSARKKGGDRKYFWK